MIAMALIKMIVTDTLPLSFEEGTRFQQCIQTIFPKYTMPSQKVITIRLQEAYDLVLKKITFNF